MKIKPLKLIAAVFAASVIVYLLTYCALVQRVVLRTPSTVSSTGDVQAQLIPLPTFRGFNTFDDGPVWKAFEPVLALDRIFMRRDYWATKMVVETNQVTRP